MNKKIVYIILVALAILILVALLWWWFLRRETNAVQNTGTFGSAQNAQQGSGGAGDGTQTNVGTPLPGQGGGDQTNGGQTTGTNIQLGNIGGSNIGSGGPGSIGGPGSGGGGTIGLVTLGPPIVVGTVGVPGVVWLSGSPPTTTTQTVITTSNPSGTSTTAITTGPGTVFNPADINQIVSSNPVGNGGILPNIGTNAYGQQVNGSGSGLGSLAAAAGAGAVTCAVVPALQTVAAELFGTKAAKSVAAGQAAASPAAAVAAASVSTIDVGANARLAIGFPTNAATIAGSQQGSQFIDQFMGCMTRNLAKILLQQITTSVVNWINSGFNGSPAFVQNPSQFLQQTADKIAGDYIKSSALSFLCSPFQLKVRIAIAQSYANRNAGSCTLTQVSNNITGFMRGTFSTAGGWPAFLSFTSMPTNNPYGAFLYGSAGIGAATANAQNQTKTDLLQGGGFLSFQQKVPGSCVNTTSPPPPSLNKSVTEVSGPANPSNPTQQLYQVCDYVSTTPGRIIASSLESTMKGSIDQLTLAKSFDEIISALINQLITRTLQGGLSNLSGANGYASNFYTTDQLQTQTQQQTLISQMQNDTSMASQYGAVQQGSIQDIENVQNQLNDVYNCWSNIAGQATTTSVTDALRATATTNATGASTTINSLNVTIGGYNERISKVNTAIVTLTQLQSRALSVTSSSELSSVQSDYSSSKAAGLFPTQADVTNAQQNRTTLQSQMSVTSQQATLSLQQCNAIH
jgi:hypothetical protein